MPQTLPLRTHLRILPRVWATASLANATEALETQRKGPHNLQLVPAEEKPVWEAPTAVRGVEPQMAFYRKYTEGILRRYAAMSLEAGRVPSLLGRELFAGNVSNYKVSAFDDVVIFVHDVNRCLEAIPPGMRHLLRRIAIEGYTYPETAELLGIGLRTIIRRYVEAIDTMTRLLIDREILIPNYAAQEDGDI